MFRFMLLYASLGGAAATTLRLPAAVGCKADEDCSLNGICAPGGVCQCHPGWKGAACSFLDRRPAASESAAAVYGMHRNVTSWGGNVLADNSTGLHHLYVTEIAGPNGTSCGLISWGSHSTIVHAVSTSGIAGPYVKKSVAVGHEGHNPQAIRYKGQWVIFPHRRRRRKPRHPFSVPSATSTSLRLIPLQSVLPSDSLQVERRYLHDAATATSSACAVRHTDHC